MENIMEMTNLDAYVKHILDDYAKFMTDVSSDDEIRNKVRNEMIENFKVYLEKGSKYLKVMTGKQGGQQSVHSFICLNDMGKFTKGDILKAASWKAPARNFARGNLFQGDFSKVRWTGA
jgi:hypothetical protein